MSVLKEEQLQKEELLKKYSNGEISKDEFHDEMDKLD